MKETLVYLDGGETYIGTLKSKPLAKWKEYGRKKKQKYLYKGFHYYAGGGRSVVVFDTKAWGSAEINRRKENGFLGIKSYYL